MNKFFMLMPLAALLASCHHHKPINLHPADVPADTPLVGGHQLIVPGKSIGDIVIGERLDSVTAGLGKPDSGDNAMGASLNTWYTKHDPKGYQTDVYSHRNYGAKDENVSRVKLVRVTSPWFKTVDQIGAGSALSLIKQKYQARHIGDYISTNDTLQIYDDTKQGIGFEVRGNKCKGMFIHAPRDSTSTYISLHPGMTFKKAS